MDRLLAGKTLAREDFLEILHARSPETQQMLAREACQDYGQFNVNVYFIQKGVTAADPDSRSPVSAVYYGTDLRYPKREMPKDGYLNGLIAFLLTPEAAPLTGSDLRSDGGMTLYYVHRRKVEGRPYFDERK